MEYHEVTNTAGAHWRYWEAFYDTEKKEKLVELAKSILDNAKTNNAHPAVIELRETELENAKNDVIEAQKATKHYRDTWDDLILADIKPGITKSEQEYNESIMRCGFPPDSRAEKLLKEMGTELNHE